ncbi:hypothetical protein GS966_27615 [Rhodococcus hoagii]|nr:hypothetical protein [Prescottella equi]NKS10245.1 hypothetical protein [Prescottella equi]NKS35236.1 hypothetical protein [Prescottella equi]NKS62083.1 hypothetical protein [Prescottella equi]NKS68247.1 hypothetical protein [Prescottella equi]
MTYPASPGVEIQEVSAPDATPIRVAWIEAESDSTDPLDWMIDVLEGGCWVTTGALRRLEADDVNSIEDGWTVAVERRPFAPRGKREIELRAHGSAPEVGGGVMLNLPMSELHRDALVRVALAYYQATDPSADLDSIADNVQLDDGDLVWIVGGGLDLLFTVVRSDIGEFVRAMSRTASSWRTEADWPVAHSDHFATARTIWQLILNATW